MAQGMTCVAAALYLFQVVSDSFVTSFYFIGGSQSYGGVGRGMINSSTVSSLILSRGRHRVQEMEAMPLAQAGKPCQVLKDQA